MILSVLYRIPFDDSYDFEWYHIFAFPMGYAFIKYGWRWIRNIIDITEEDYLSTDDIYYQKAVKQAQLSLNTFLNYVKKGEEECYAKFSVLLKTEQVKPVWGIVHYFDSERYKLNVSIITELYKEELYPGRKFIAPDKLEDWQVVKEEGILGFFTYSARVKKAQNEGFRLNYKSKEISESIIT